MLGISGKGVHIASLALGIYCIEGKRRLAASAQACNHYKLPTRNRKRHILKVMRLCTLYIYMFVFIHDSN